MQAQPLSLHFPRESGKNPKGQGRDEEPADPALGVQDGWPGSLTPLASVGMDCMDPTGEYESCIAPGYE